MACIVVIIINSIIIITNHVVIMINEYQAYFALEHDFWRWHALSTGIWHGAGMTNEMEWHMIKRHFT